MKSQKPIFRKFWDLGYTRLVPIVPPDAELSEKSSLFKRPGARGKAVGIKGDDGLWRGFDWIKHTTTHSDLERWQAMGAGVGIKTGDGIVAIDIDSLDTSIANEAVELAFKLFGNTPVRIGRAPKCLLVYRVTQPVGYQRVEFTGYEGMNERVELLSDGRQFVAHGIHPTTKNPYRWYTDADTPGEPLHYDELPEITPAKITDFFLQLAHTLPKATLQEKQTNVDRASVNQHNLTGNLEDVTKAIRALPNTTKLFPTYDDYIRVGAAIKGATQEDPQMGVQLFLEWAGKWEGENDLERAEGDFSRIKPPYELGSHWLYDMASKYAPEAFNAAELWFQPVEDMPDDNPFAIAAAREAAQGQTEQMRRFEFTSLMDAAENPISAQAAPLVKGLLDQGAMSIIYGESNTGKSFVAMDIAFHVAAGLPWGGMRTTQFPAVYIAAEGGLGIRKRAAALKLKYSVDAPRADLQFLLTSVDLFNPDADLKPLITAIAGLSRRVGLVVIDTLSRAMAGGDENSPTDMGRLVKHFDLLRAATGAHLMTVHHSGKDRARGARGHSLLKAATDTEIEIADNQIAVTKQRDLDKSYAAGFALDVVEFGKDAEGDAVTSCTMRLIARNAVVVGVATPREQDILDALRVLEGLSADGREGVALKDVMSFVSKNVSDMKEVSVRGYLKDLAAKRLIESPQRGKWKTVCPNGGTSPADFFAPIEEKTETSVFA